MDAITFLFRSILSLLFLLLVQADSILFSHSIINHYFNQSQSYIYTAARLDDPQANYQLYVQTQDKHWLRKAASLNHIESVFQWYLIQHENQHISQNVWLQQAINLGHKQAILIKLNQFIEEKSWPLAKEFQQQYSDVLNSLEGELSVKYQSIKSLLSVSALSEKNTSEIFQIQQPINDELAINAKLQCAITIQPFVETQILLGKAEQFEAAFLHSKLKDLAVCFLPPQTLLELQVVCEPDKYNRINCDLDQLAQTLLKNVSVNPITYNRVLVIVEQGDANTRGGLMYLDEQDSDQVFIHELAHWLGYIDEYQIKPKQQEQLCKVTNPKWISPNLFVTSKHLNIQQAEAAAGQPLYLANTCKGSDFQAYKKHNKPSFMEFLNLPLTDQYAADIKQNVSYSSILPVSMNFWVNYSSRIQGEKKDNLTTNEGAHQKQFMQEQHLIWLKISAAQNFTPAMTLLAQYYIELGLYSDAHIQLLQAAKLGNANAQLLLGHGYIEGRWLPQDVVKSAYWYQQAALQNDPYGLYFYAKCHEMGWGCKLSYEKAIDFYQQAKKNGSKLAIKRLSHLRPKL